MPTALIVGAGVGGLSAALALRRAGWEIRVFERAMSPRELGFGLLVAPNAIAALRELGVADVVLARGWAPTHGEVRRMDGTVLTRAAFPPPEAMGGPTIVALRPALHGALLDALGIEAITLDAHAAGFSEADDRVALQLANGEVAEGDLLIGADGIGSVVRRALHPTERPPRSSGIVAVRGGVHGAEHHLCGLSGIYYLGAGVEAFVVRASDTGIYWALSLARELVPAGMTDPSAVLDLMAPKMDATFREITSMPGDLRYDELFDRDPIPFWGTGVVTLLGDAAHPVLPHTGQGAAQAIVDAVTLGQALASHGAIAPALRRYETERRDTTAALVAQGRRTARLMRNRNRAVCYARELAVRLIPVKPMVRLFARINRRAGTDVRHYRIGLR